MNCSILAKENLCGKARSEHNVERESLFQTMEIHLLMHVNTLFNEGEQEKKRRRGDKKKYIFCVLPRGLEGRSWDKSVTRDLYDGNVGL